MENIYKNNGRVDILDIGGTKQYWGILPDGFLEERNVYITLLNLPMENRPKNEKRYIYIDGDACELSHIADYAFSIVHSNSVIEHVGDWKRMLLFSKEVKRLAKTYYVQTPHYWFPIEPHFMTLFYHWLPMPIRVSLIMKMALGNMGRQDTVSGAVQSVESARLLDIKMFKELFEGADITTEKLLFLPKSLIAISSEQI